MKSGTCPKCAGTTIRPLHTHDAVDGGGRQLELHHYEHPSAIFFKGTTRFPLTALACFGCGYVEFYLTDPEKGKQALGV